MRKTSQPINIPKSEIEEDAHFNSTRRGPKKHIQPTFVAPLSLAPRTSGDSGFKDPCFPEIDKNNFSVLPPKQLSSLLRIAYVGIQRPNSDRLWSFCLSTPSSIVEDTYSQQNKGTTYDRLMLTPDYFNEVHGSDFNDFLDRIEAISQVIRQLLLEGGEDVSKWKSPVRISNGTVAGLQVKVRTCTLSEKARGIQGPMRCVIKLSCAYFTPDRSGIAFELVDVFPTVNPYTPPSWTQEANEEGFTQVV